MKVLLIGNGQEVVAVWLSIIDILRPVTAVTIQTPCDSVTAVKIHNDCVFAVHREY